MSRNAATLDTFLDSKILPHKKRWLLAVGGSWPENDTRKMTLDHKATSALESVNQTMKYSCSNKVKPAMSLRESLRTQDSQVDHPLRERNLSAFHDARSRSLYARSPTVNFVTKQCEQWVTDFLDPKAGANYQFGDITKQFAAKFTGKDEYQFGDVTKKVFGNLFGKRERKSGGSQS
jgi:hypothetical protein